MSTNHLVDPTFFYDAIDEFAFDYDWFATTGISTDDHFRQVRTFDKRTIRGSLQTGGTKLNFDKARTNNSSTYNFYCKSLYRINIGDFIYYKNKYLLVNSVLDYDEFGVRSCILEMVNISEYQDFNDYINYLNGDKIV